MLYIDVVLKCFQLSWKVEMGVKEGGAGHREVSSQVDALPFWVDLSVLLF